MDYHEFVKQAKEGQILIGVEPAIARKFFTGTNRSTVKEKIGESLYIQRFFVKTCWLLEPICFFAGVITSIFALKWYSILAIPLMVISFFFMGAKASMGRQKIRNAVFLVFAFVILAYYFRFKGMFMVAWLVLLPMPYLFARLTYKLSTMFLRFLSMRNERAFNQMYDKAIFLKKKEDN